MTDVASECPFCGGTQFVRVAPFQFPRDDEGEAWKWGFHVICDASGIDTHPRGCGCSGAWGETEAEAISAWNRRTDTAVVWEEAVETAARIISPNCHWDAGYVNSHIERRRDNARAKARAVLGGTRSPTGGREAGLEAGVTMQAVVRVDEFNGQTLWECTERDGRGEVSTHETVELAASTFPIGTKLLISEPTR